MLGRGSGGGRPWAGAWTARVCAGISGPRPAPSCRSHVLECVRDLWSATQFPVACQGLTWALGCWNQPCTVLFKLSLFSQARTHTSMLFLMMTSLLVGCSLSSA